jgi:tetratricopeptide (TPR) repeat protein
MNLGRAYDRAFQFEKALECKRKAAELSPNDPEVSYSLGCSFCSKGDFLSATKSFEEALKLKPDFLEACEAIAEQYQILGKPGKADEWLLKADRIRFGKQN